MPDKLKLIAQRGHVGRDQRQVLTARRAQAPLLRDEKSYVLSGPVA